MTGVQTCALPISDDAWACATRALAIGDRLRPIRARVLRLFGEIASLRDPPDTERAEAHSRQALGLADELGMRPLVAKCHLDLARLHRRTGRRDQARAQVAAAAAMFREMDMRFGLEQVEAEVKELALTSAP